MVHEAVFVADLQAGDPPVVHVGVVTAGVGDVDAPPAAEDAGIAVLEVAQAVQVVQIPGDAGVLAVDLQRVQGLVPSGVTGALEDAEAAVGESAKKRASVVDAEPRLTGSSLAITVPRAQTA